MSQLSETSTPASATATVPEKNARTSHTDEAPTPHSVSIATKPRSCIICRSRKVRCDKQSPCSNCRRANTPCVFPSTNRPPRWTRRLDRLTNNLNHASPGPGPNARPSMDAKPAFRELTQRLRSLEGLVKELSGQLEQAQSAFASAGTESSELNSPERSDEASSTNTSHGGRLIQSHSADDSQLQFGRLVLQDSNRSHYVSSGFWSRVNDELNSLKDSSVDLAEDGSDSSDDEISSGNSPAATRELGRTPLERHAFLFRHNLSAPIHDLREFHPLPSQIPFLLDTFAENVNFILQIVHVPTVRKMIREVRNADITHLTPTNEALMFSIYYATVTSMEEDDVMTNFGYSKSDLNLKYRIGLEHALAKADFLNAPELTIVQALCVFLCLVGRYDSPKYCWMMAGIVIRMSQYLGLHRDGTSLQGLTPYQIEMRRRVWWAVCNIDLKASEDQGTDLAIKNGTFDTKFPLNVNDADIDVDMKDLPPEREGVTDMTFAYISAGLCDVTKQVLASTISTDPAGLEQQNHLVNGIYRTFEEGYLRHTEELGDITYWVSVTIARLVMAKLRLMSFLPILFSDQSETFSDELRTNLMISALEIIEYNHALNAEERCRKWRWIFQIYSHWYAIVYLMIELSRRPWSSTIERGWVALHSSWLLPTKTLSNKNLRIWVPFRRLMAAVRKHRVAELNRLRSDPDAVARLEQVDRNLPVPTSSGFSPSASTPDQFRERWRQLVTAPEQSTSHTVARESSTSAGCIHPPFEGHGTSSEQGYFSSDANFNPTYPTSGESVTRQTQEARNSGQLDATRSTYAPNQSTYWEQAPGPSTNTFSAVSSDWLNVLPLDGPGPAAWLWNTPEPDSIPDHLSGGDTNNDVEMDSSGNVNWYRWVEAAEGWSWDANADMDLSGGSNI